MASQGRKRVGVRNSSKEEQGVLARLSESAIVQKTRSLMNDGSYVTKKLMKSTGKAVWIFGTSFLILAVPLIIEMDREQLAIDFELQQANILGGPVAQ